jgi:hypothetical protein
MFIKIGAAVLALLMSHPWAPKPKLPRDYQAWSRVAACESGGWTVLGPAYPDSLGISRANYERFGGRPLSPGPVSPAARVAQVRVADRLVASYGAAIPDQYGCGAW